MSRIFRKYENLLLIVFFVVIIVAICLLGMLAFKGYKSAIASRDAEIATMKDTLNNIGDLQDGYVVVANVRVGQKITEDTIQKVSVPTKLGLNVATSEDELLNKYYKVSLSDGSVITKDDVIDYKLDNTARYLDVYVSDVPIGLEEGDYIDIRISFPLGQDFIGISHKKVVSNNSGILKLELTESEIYAYRSMLVDVAMYDAQLYAIEYVDGGAQTSAEVYYPINKNLQTLMKINPNITDIIEAKIALERAQLEEENGGGVSDKTEEQLKNVNDAVKNMREKISSKITNAQQDLAKRIAEQSKAQDSNSGGSGNGSITVTNN